MWVLLQLRRSQCPHHILSSLMFKYFHVKLHKLYYFVYAQMVITDLRLKSTRQFCVEHMLFICGNKMPTRCNRGFYCRSYCLLNMFRAPLCPSSGARVLYSGCCLWYFMLWFSSCWSGVELRVMCPVCRMLQHNT